MMISNVSNDLKHKIINNEMVTKRESILFINYMRDKSKLIIDRSYGKNNNYMNLFKEIAFSYNMIFKYIDNHNGLILYIGKYIYLVDLDFNSNKILELYNNKYIECTDNVLSKYIEIGCDRRE